MVVEELQHTNKQEHIFIVDGSGYIFRAFHALPPLTRTDGTPVGAVLGFVNMLLKLLNQSDGTHLVVVFDAARKNFRNDIYPEYKANRGETPEDLIPQFPLIREACKAFNVPTVEMDGYEADDLIATYTNRMRDRGGLVTIVSSDKDLMQLVDAHVDMLDPMKNRTIATEEVLEKFGVKPEKVVDVQALAGDSSDNVPGVPGIGVKTAAELINQYGSLESLLEKATEIKQPKRRQNLIEFAEMARVSKKLVQLESQAPIETSLDEFEKQVPDFEEARTFLEQQNFHSVINRLKLKKEESPSPIQQEKKEATYETVNTTDSLNAWIEKIKKAGLVAIDTETTSLNAMQAELVGISLCIDPYHACYIPVAHKQESGADLFDMNPSKPLVQQLSKHDVLQALKPVLQDESILKVGQNLKYDMLVLKNEGVEISPIEDTMVLSFVLDGSKHRHGLDELSKLYLDHTPIAFKDVVGTGKNQKTFDYVDIDQATQYAAEDADLTMRLYNILKPRLSAEKKTTIYQTLERPLVSVLAQIEHNGVLVDPLFLNDLSRLFAGRLQALEDEIHSIAGTEFNIASPKQLGEVLFDNLQLPGGKKGKTGAYGTNVEVLEELASQGHDIATKLLEWRQLSKLKSTYTDALVKQINPKTKRVHTSYTQTFTTTGRLSSQDPNLQNIPIRTEEGRKIRKAFIAPDGFEIVSFDYSQIELRLLAHVAAIDSLQQAFKEGKDIHALTASQVFGIPLEQIDSATRRKAKAINFGIIYGISAFGLSRQLDIPQKEAAQYIEAYFTQYPGIRAYMENTKEFARKNGFVETIFKRQLPIVDINNRNGMRRSFAERQAINAPLQGSSADIIKKAMIQIHKKYGAQREKIRMVLQVHDELVFEIEKSMINDFLDDIKQIMEDATQLSLPLVVDASIGKSWGDLKEVN